MTDTRQDTQSATPPGADAWTTRKLLSWMTQRFEAESFDVPRVVAEMLAAHVFGCDRIRLYMEVDRPASADELITLRGLVRRALDHEPVQYLVGNVTFLSREFEVNASTLIPQPCTEELVEHVLQWIKDQPANEDDVPGPVIADIGTGCGCIAISLAAMLPECAILATDIMPEALELAARNAERLKVAGRVEFAHGSLVTPLRDSKHAGRFDVICSNPPYVPDHEWNGGQVDPSVKNYVPETATRGGPDGLDCLRPLIADAPAVLTPGGLLIVEHADAHHEALLALASDHPLLENARIENDHDGFHRFLLAERSVD